MNSLTALAAHKNIFKKNFFLNFLHHQNFGFYPLNCKWYIKEFIVLVFRTLSIDALIQLGNSFVKVSKDFGVYIFWRVIAKCTCILTLNCVGFCFIDDKIHSASLYDGKSQRLLLSTKVYKYKFVETFI